MTDAATTLILLYGGLGGWLGMFLAVYLYLIRPEPAHPSTVLGVFTLGFAMLMATVLISDAFLLSRAEWFGVLFVTYTLMVLSEVGLFAEEMYPDMTSNIYDFLFRPPHFARPERPLRRDGGPTPEQAPLERYHDDDDR